MRCVFYSPTLGLSNAVPTIDIGLLLWHLGLVKVRSLRNFWPQVSPPSHYFRIFESWRKTATKTCAVLSRNQWVCASETFNPKLQNGVPTTCARLMVQKLWRLQKLFSPQNSLNFATFQGEMTEKCKPWAQKNANQFFWPTTGFEPWVVSEWFTRSSTTCVEFFQFRGILCGHNITRSFR